MKCTVCATEYASGRACPNCGCVSPDQDRPAAVKRHWETGAKSVKTYEDRRESIRSSSAGDASRKNKKAWLRRIGLAAVAAALAMTVGRGICQQLVNYAGGWWAHRQGDLWKAHTLLEQVDDDLMDAGAIKAECARYVWQQNYYQAERLYLQGEYLQALEALEPLRSGGDVEEMILACQQKLLVDLVPGLHWQFAQNLEEAQARETTTPVGDVDLRNIINSRGVSAAAFDGNGDLLKLGNGMNVTENWSLEMLFVPRRNGDMVLLGKQSAPDSGCWRLGMESQRVVFTMMLGDGSQVRLESQELIWASQRWHHAVVVRQGGDLRLYLDGTLTAQATLTASPVHTEEEVTLGGDVYEGYETAENPWFHGYVAELAVYDQAIQPALVRGMYDKVAFQAERVWDTNYPQLPPEAVQQHFVIYRSLEHEGRVEAQVFDVVWPEEEDALCWNESGQSLTFVDDSELENCQRYYLTEEGWVLDQEMEELYAWTVEPISSDLRIYQGYQLMMDQIILGG